MTILDQLSSRLDDRTETANARVAEQCLAMPALLGEVSEGLLSKEAAIAGDCAEVMTKVAEEQPQWVAPYAPALITLLSHKNTRVRWEAAHALAFVAEAASLTIAANLASLAEIIRNDKSIIVRDYTVDAVGNYARSGAQAAREAYPILKEALTVWEGKHAGHALAGLANVVTTEPSLREEISSYGKQYLEDKRGVVRKAARTLIKSAKEKVLSNLQVDSPVS